MEASLSDASFEEGSSYWLFLEVFSGIMDGFRADARVGSTNPFAVGQLINHPPEGVRPNVEWQDFSWGDDEGEDSVDGAAEGGFERVNRLHKGLWYIDPVTAEPVNMPEEAKIPVPGVAIITRREIAVGEELFLNYRFHAPYPEWYTPVDNDDRA